MSPEVGLRKSPGKRIRSSSETSAGSFEQFFRPRGIVVIGASGDPKKLGFVLTRNLLRSGYSGAVHLVNRRGKRALSRPLFSNVSEVPDPVDLAIIVVPAPGVPEALEGCADRGISAAIIISGGFRESGDRGRKLEERCLEVSRRRGIRLIGPNCIGIIDNHTPLDTTFLTPPGAPEGEVGLISQSGSLCAAAIDWSRQIGMGWSRIVSLGNQIDLTETDLLAPVASDPNTRVIGLYLEGIIDGRGFVEEAARISQSKPIVALKVGHTKSGHAAVSSHTGAMAGEDHVYEAALRRAGIFRAHTTEEMFHAARSLAWAPIPQGSSVAVLTNAGGPGVVAVDELEHQGLKCARFSAKTARSLRQILPRAASVSNPVDMLASATAEHFADCLEAVVADAGVDAVLIILPPPPAYPAEDVVDALLPIIEETPKPVVWALMGGARVDTAEQRLESVKVPVYRFPEPAIAGLAALVHRGRFLQKSQDHDSPPLDVDTEQVLETAKEYDAALMPDEAAAIVAAAGIPTAQTCRVQSGRSAIRTARRLGYPVVLKSAAPGVVHKTDLGGVTLGIPGRTALTGAFRHMRQQSELAKRSNGDQIFFLQRMAPEGIDVVVGAIRDPQFGPIVMFGTGGIVTELRADVAFDLAPLSEHDALEMIDNTEAGLMLHGFRGKPALNTRPVADVICRMAALLQIVPELTELEINPLRVHEGGVVALDVRGTLVRPDAD